MNDQTRKLEIGQKLQREASVKLANIDEDERTVEIAFSSETPYDRWWGTEVLVHTKDAVNLERLNDGGALLNDHNTRDQIGAVVPGTARIDDDNIARCTIRFSRAQKGFDAFRDVQDGIRTKVSVGYFIHSYKETERDGMLPLIEVTDWEPYEVSLVSVPADPSVGVGRSAEVDQPLEKNVMAENEADPNNERIDNQSETFANSEPNGDTEMSKTANTPAAEPKADDAIQAERGRIGEIRAIAKRHGVENLGDQAIDDGSTVDQFRTKVLDSMNARDKTQPLEADDMSREIGLTNNEADSFSFVRLINAMAFGNQSTSARDAAEFEFEACEAAAKRAGKDSGTMTVPFDVLTRALGPTTGGAGLIGTNHDSASFIEMMRNRSLIMQYATPQKDLIGNHSIPKQNGSANTFWVGDDEDVTGSAFSTGNFDFSPHTLGAHIELTRRQIKQSSPDVKMLVRRDLAEAMALGIDKGAIYADGTGGQLLGIVNTNGINVVNFTTAGAPKWGEIVEMETLAGADGAGNGLRYLVSSSMRGKPKTTTLDAGSGQFIWTAGTAANEGMVNGYAASVTNQMAAADALFGNLAQLIVAMWGGLDLLVDPYTQQQKGGLRVTTHQDCDFGLRRASDFTLGR